MIAAGAITSGEAMTDVATKLVLLFLAAAAFSGGGVFTEVSEGLSRPWPAALIFVLLRGRRGAADAQA